LEGEKVSKLLSHSHFFQNIIGGRSQHHSIHNPVVIELCQSLFINQSIKQKESNMEPEATPTPSTDEPPAAPAAAETSEPLPDGWETAVSPVDGRAYFYNPTTGATSWTHPSLPATNPESTPDIQDVPSVGDFSGIIANRTVEDYGDKTADVESGMYMKMTDYDPKQPIHTHRWYAVLATILFLPLGAIALCKSFSCAKKWKQELYE